MHAFDFQCRTRIVFGPGKIESLGELASELGARRVLVVSDPGVVAAGHTRRGMFTKIPPRTTWKPASN
jgi:alcohol dehydrogenase